MGFFNYWILYWNLNYFSYSNLSSIKVSQLVMRIFRCYFTCFYTTFTRCVTILFFFTLLMLNFEPDIKNVTSLSTVTRETNWKRCSFVRIGFLVVSLLLSTPRFFYIRDIWQTSSQLTNKVCFSGFFFCRQSITKSYSHISRAFLLSVSWRIAQLLMNFIILIVVIQDLRLQLLHYYH